jgi:hypothetical protein
VCIAAAGLPSMAIDLMNSMCERTGNGCEILMNEFEMVTGKDFFQLPLVTEDFIL